MTAKDHNYGVFNSYDLLKFIAIVTMLVDHLGLFFFRDIEIYRVIGRIAYVLFIFCVGYNQKYSFDSKLLVLGLIMCLASFIGDPDKFHLEKFLTSSILFSIIITRFVLQYIIKILNDNNIYIITSILWCLNILTFEFLQYGTAGILIALCGYLIGNNKLKVTNNSVFLSVNLMLYAGYMTLKMKFSYLGNIILAGEFLLIFIILRNFTIHSVSSNNNCAKLMKFVARHSLIIYFVHFELFYLISKFI